MYIHSDVSWIVSINKADRGYIANAFRGTQWAKKWSQHADLWDDGDVDAGYNVSIEVNSIEELHEALNAAMECRADYGVEVCSCSDFKDARSRHHIMQAGGPDETPKHATLSAARKAVGDPIELQCGVVKAAVRDLEALVQLANLN
jgi:hypothetical protein